MNTYLVTYIIASGRVIIEPFKADSITDLIKVMETKPWSSNILHLNKIVSIVETSREARIE